MPRRSGTLVIALVVLGACSAAGAAGPAPPTLPTEADANSVASFRCPRNPVSTVEIEACEGRRLLELGRQFNARAAVLWPILDARGKQSFLGAHQAWLTYRKEMCTARSRAFLGGTIAPVVYGQCEIELTKARLQELASTLDSYCRGRARTGPYKRCPRS